MLVCCNKSTITYLRVVHNRCSFRPATQRDIGIVFIVISLVWAKTVRTSLAFR